MNSPIRTIQPTLCNGLKPNDIKSYKHLPPKCKRLARERAIRILQSMQVGYVETSILPTYLIVELWNNHVHYKDQRAYQLLTSKSFDDGTVFHIENKS